jgi:murein DD-endopeptidase MepM/ murein hydrolase activator NlpD
MFEFLLSWLTAATLLLPHFAPVLEPVEYNRPISGQVVRYFDPPPQNWLPGHRGVKFAGLAGEPVFAPAVGQVTFAGKVAGKPVVTITHADGLRSSFEPLLPEVAVGDLVTAGQMIGVIGYMPAEEGANSSSCPDGNGTCIHWGVRRGEIYLDPLWLLGLAGPIVLLPH